MEQRSIMPPSNDGKFFDKLPINDVWDLLFTTFATDLEIQGLNVCRVLLDRVQVKFYNAAFQFERNDRQQRKDKLFEDRQILKAELLKAEPKT